MRVIAKTEYIPTEEDREDEDYEPLLSIEEQSEPVTLELTTPVESSGEMINELTVNPPRAKNVLKSRSRRNSKGDEETTRTDEFFAKACNVPIETIGNLLVKDLNRLGNLIMAFTEQTPKARE